ncbi:MAG TPA: hypothetical protein VG838_10390 [Opitutaceae bacterium]|nr:hypothetical protein [Opitutaceae bacterium]
MPVSETTRRFGSVVVLLALALAIAWLWRCLCLYPAHGWNEIRIVPAFMLAQGNSPYPGESGPATTWIYGPLPLLLQLPATLARNATQALVVSGLINVLVTVAAVGIAVRSFSRRQPGAGGAAPLVAGLLCIALWPVTAFEFIQADNAAVAAGLVSLVCLQDPAPRRRRCAALMCAAAVACKQTLLGLALGECIYLFYREGLGAAVRHAVWIGTVTAVLLAGAALAFGPAALAYDLFVLPSRLPWASSLPRRLAEFWPYLAVHAGIPLAAAVVLGPRIWRKDSPWLLPFCAWAAAWPLDLAALLKTGGSINALHGWLFFLPPAAALALAGSRSSLPRQLGVPALIAALLMLRLFSFTPPIWRPLQSHLREGDFLARSLPGEIYFPWHPLLTFFADHRFDHAEDGLFIRRLAGIPVSGPALAAHLPPRFHAVAFLRGEADWGIARELVPASAQPKAFGNWTLYSWDLPAGSPPH